MPFHFPRSSSFHVVVTGRFSIGLRPVNFNHNGGVSAINLSQRTVIVRETVHGAVRYGTYGTRERARGPRTILSCPYRAMESRTRGSRTWLRRGKCHLRGGRGASTCAPSVGCGSRALGVITSTKKKRETTRTRLRRLYSRRRQARPPGTLTSRQ